MSIKYKVVKQVFGFDKTRTEKFVVRPVTGEMLTYDKVCNQVCQITGIHRGIVTVVIGGLLDVMVNNLDMGHSVKLDEFGILRPGLRAKAQNSEKEADANTVYRRRIIFTPGRMLKELLDRVAVTRMAIQDTDYTDSSSTGGGSGSSGGDDDDYVDPGA